jgi:membrane protease YdiL (CAAX protease family)
MSNSLPMAPRRKGWAILSWVVILLTVAGIVGQRYLPLGEQAAEQADAQGVRIRLVLLELQGRYFVGASQLLGPLGGDLTKDLPKLNRGSVDQRLHWMTLSGEMAGPAATLEHLNQFNELCRKNQVELTPTQERLRTILGRLYHDYDRGQFQAPSVAEADRAFLVEQMGWFGDLATHPRESDDVAGRQNAIRPTFFTLGAVLGGIALAGLFTLAGSVGAILSFVLALQRMVSWRIATGSPNGGVYAETFALWLLGYYGVSVLAGLALPNVPHLLRAGAVMLASLAVLGWPMLRGVSWRQLRRDIGLTCEANPLVEIAAGVWCYIINLPLVAFGVAMTVVMMLLQAKLLAGDGNGGPAGFDTTAEPAHPIMQYLSDGDWSSRLQIFVLASVIAPLVEEIMFRGLLHRHLREMTRRCGPIISALATAIVVSFLFAAIHPQGLVAIPPLMFMACGFSLAREWRGSLLPSMFAHGMSNATVMTVAMIALSK